MSWLRRILKSKAETPARRSLRRGGKNGPFRRGGSVRVGHLDVPILESHPGHYGSALPSDDLSKLPKWLPELYQFILLNGSGEQYLFRKAGARDELDALVIELNACADGESLPILTDYEIFAVADAVKLFFKRLPDPPFLYRNYDSLVAIAQAMVGDDDSRRENLKRLINTMLPLSHVVLLRDLFAFLHAFQTFAETTLMSTENLAVVFAPSLCRPKKMTMEFSKDLKGLTKMIEWIISDDDFFFPSAHTKGGKNSDDNAADDPEKKQTTDADAKDPEDTTTTTSTTPEKLAPGVEHSGSASKPGEKPAPLIDHSAIPGTSEVPDSSAAVLPSSASTEPYDASSGYYYQQYDQQYYDTSGATSPGSQQEYWYDESTGQYYYYDPEALTVSEEAEAQRLAELTQVGVSTRPELSAEYAEMEHVARAEVQAAVLADKRQRLLAEIGNEILDGYDSEAFSPPSPCPEVVDPEDDFQALRRIRHFEEAQRRLWENTEAEADQHGVDIGTPNSDSDPDFRMEEQMRQWEEAEAAGDQLRLLAGFARERDELEDGCVRGLLRTRGEDEEEVLRGVFEAIHSDLVLAKETPAIGIATATEKEAHIAEASEAAGIAAKEEEHCRLAEEGEAVRGEAAEEESLAVVEAEAAVVLAAEKAAEEEAAAIAAEAEKQRLAEVEAEAAAEAARLAAAEEEEAAIAAEAEKQRLAEVEAAAEAARLAAAEEEAAAIAAEAEKQRLAEVEAEAVAEAARLAAAEEEAAAIAAEAEKQRLAEVEEAAEAARLAAAGEEAAAIAAEAEKQRLAGVEAEAAAEAARLAAAEEEAAAVAAEAEKQRLVEAARLVAAEEEAVAFAAEAEKQQLAEVEAATEAARLAGAEEEAEKLRLAEEAEFERLAAIEAERRAQEEAGENVRFAEEAEAAGLAAVEAPAKVVAEDETKRPAEGVAVAADAKGVSFEPKETLPSSPKAVDDKQPPAADSVAPPKPAVRPPPSLRVVRGSRGRGRVRVRSRARGVRVRGRGRVRIRRPVRGGRGGVRTRRRARARRPRGGRIRRRARGGRGMRRMRGRGPRGRMFVRVRQSDRAMPSAAASAASSTAAVRPRRRRGSIIIPSSTFGKYVLPTTYHSRDGLQVDENIDKAWASTVRGVDGSPGWVCASYTKESPKNLSLIGKGSAYPHLLRLLARTNDVAFAGVRCRGLAGDGEVLRERLALVVWVPKGISALKKAKLFSHRKGMMTTFYGHHFIVEASWMGNASENELRMRLMKMCGSNPFLKNWEFC